MKNENMVFDNYQNLAHAIIIQAVEDYRNARRVLALSVEEQEKLQEKQKKYYDVVRASKHRKREVTKFLGSKWFTVLTSADGDMILERLSKEVLQ